MSPVLDECFENLVGYCQGARIALVRGGAHDKGPVLLVRVTMLEFLADGARRLCWAGGCNQSGSLPADRVAGTHPVA